MYLYLITFRMKNCIICKQTKELSEYYRHPQTADWYMTKCKECQKSNSRNSRTKEKDRNRYKSSPRKRLQVVFKCIMRRCYDPNDNHYKRYGAKGIKCEWGSFDEFYSDMYLSYIDHYVNHCYKNRNTQIDRIDNTWNYSKENCRRVTAKENNEFNKKKLSKLF